MRQTRARSRGIASVMTGAAWGLATCLLACQGTDANDAACVSAVPWVRSRSGGSGPAVLLCAPDGGAAPGACEGFDTDDRRPVCGAEGGHTFHRLPDGGIGGGWLEAGDPDGPPEESWRPVTGARSCPKRWRMMAEGVCDPTISTSCPVGDDPLPGGRCTNSACAAGPYPQAPTPGAGGRVVHLRDGADDESADGSAARPFGTLRGAVSAAGSGGVVLVTDGTYPAALDVTAPVTIAGRCVGRVRIDGRDGAVDAAVRVRSSGALTLLGVTVASESQGVRVEGGGHLVVRGARFESSRGDAIQANERGTTAEIENVAFAGANVPGPDRGGFAIGAFDGAVVRANEVSITVPPPAHASGATGGVRSVGSGSRVEMRGVLLRGETSQPPRIRFGLVASEGAVVEAEQVAAEAFPGYALYGSALDVRGASVRVHDLACKGAVDPGSRAVGACAVVATGASVSVDRFFMGDGVFIPAAAVNEGGDLTLSNGTLRRVSFGGEPLGGIAIASRDGSLHVSNAAFQTLPRGPILVGGGSAELTEVEVRDVGRDGSAESAITVGREGASPTLTARRLRVEGVRGAALEAAFGARVSLAESVVRGVSSPDGRRLAVGLGAGGGAQVEVVRTSLSTVEGVGVFAFGQGTRIDLSRVLIRDATRPSNEGAPAGAHCAQGASMSVRGSVVAGARTGLVANSGCHLDVFDSLVTRALDPDQAQGTGVVVTNEASARLRRTMIREAGVYGTFVGASGRLDAADVIVSDVRGGRTRPDGTTADAPFAGVGFAVIARGAATLRRVAVVDVGSAAVFVGLGLPDGATEPVGQASVDADELFVRGVEARSLLDNLRGTSPPIAVGLYNGTDCSLNARRATIERADVGLVLFSPRAAAQEGVMERVRCGVQTTEQIEVPEALLSHLRVVPPGVLRCVEVLSDQALPTVRL